MEKSKAKKTDSDEGLPEVYKSILRQMTTYLGIASLLATSLFFLNWNNPQWKMPWAFVVWTWFILFNVFWSYYIQNVKNVNFYEIFRITVNYINVVVIFYLTGGAVGNFWLPTAICIVGSSTTLFLTSGKIRWSPLGYILLYLALFTWDLKFSSYAISSVSQVLLILIPLFATVLKISNVLEDQYHKIIEKHQRYLSSEFEKVKAESANKAKSQFLANMNHEIRTPLASISGFMELLDRGGINQEEQNHYISIIQRNIKHLQCLISDILDLSKIESEQLNPKFEKVNIKDEVSSVIESMTKIALDKNLYLNCFYSSDLPEALKTDPVYFRQILINIINNAIKYTQSGGIKITLSHEVLQNEMSKELVKIRILVKDTGSAIPAEMKEKIFEPFTQLNNDPSLSRLGYGLGLPLSKKLAQKLGGDIRLVSSEMNKGSIFEISLICELVNKETSSYDSTELKPVEEPKKLPLKGVRILVVEDNPDTQVLIKTILENSGAETTQAYNGKEALETLSEYQFNIILMDLEMPLLNGFETIVEIKKRGIVAPVIAFTANALKDVQDKVFEMGFVGYQTKPISQDKLISQLAKFA